MRQDFPIVLLSFNRPVFFERVARSLSEQIDANLPGRPIALFQDGAINKFSGKRRAEDGAIQANLEIFNRYFPSGRSFVADSNLGVALNFERAERHVFEELNQDAALFFEDDLLLSPFYVNTLDQLTEMALRDDRIGYVSAYGIQGPGSERLNRELPRYETLGHLWGFGLTKRLWQRNRPFVDPYLQLVRNIDYRQRDARAIYRLFSSWGMGCPGTSQDCAKHLACVANGAINLNTSVSLAKYIGAAGLHMDRGLFDFVGYDRTEMYLSGPPCLPVLEDKVLEEIGRVHLQWATEVASPFPLEAAIPGFELWNFAISMMNIPRVEPALITLQDRLQLSISMLLFCCWHGHRGRRLSRPDLLEAIGHLETWERDVLGAMRKIRRTVMSDISFAGSGLTSFVYRRSLFGWEQEAYKIGLFELQKLSLAGVAGAPCARANIEQYLSVVGIAPGEAIETEVLIAASETVADYPAPISGIASSRSNR
jgi:uncharacterized protein (TIGR02444 family)